MVTSQLCLFLLNLGVDSFSYVMNWKLRRVNLEILKQAFPYNHHQIVALHLALEIKELNQKYSESIKTLPQHERELTSIYKNIKRAISFREKSQHKV